VIGADATTPAQPRGRLLVVGGGIAGISAAVEAAEAGCDVVLVEREPVPFLIRAFAILSNRNQPYQGPIISTQTGHSGQSESVRILIDRDGRMGRQEFPREHRGRKRRLEWILTTDKHG